MSNRYIPALRFKWLTPLYDPLLKWVMREETFKRHIVQRVNPQPAMDLLDLGCGTGTLTLMLKRAYPDANITGLDGDPQVLEIARKKSGSVDIQWEQGLATALPYPTSRFDRVVTSLVIHHLVAEDKRRAFKEIQRVLKPNGQLYVLDFGAPDSPLARFVAFYMRSLEEAADNFAGLIPQFLTETGFQSVKELDHSLTLFGPTSLWSASKG